jgi:hypothetical protein
MREKAIQRLRIPPATALEALKELESSPDAPSTGALDRARQIAHLLQSEGSPAPFVFPTEIGGIQFEWKSNGREVDIEVLPEGTHLSFLTLVSGKITSEGDIPENFERGVRTLLSWMVSPATSLKPSLAV